MASDFERGFERGFWAGYRERQQEVLCYRVQDGERAAADLQQGCVDVLRPDHTRALVRELEDLTRGDD